MAIHYPREPEGESDPHPARGRPGEGGSADGGVVARLPDARPAPEAESAPAVQPRPARRWLRALLPVAILAVAVAIVAHLVSTRPVIERSPIPERAWTISTVDVEIADVQPSLELRGEVVAGRQVELRPLVGGRVVEVGQGYVEGGTVRRGELIVAIDPFEYEAAVADRQAQLAEARARLDELEAERAGEASMLDRDREQLALATRETERREALLSRGTGTQKALDDARRELSETQLRVIARNQAINRLTARMAQQRAVIEQRQVALDRAARDLEQTRLFAPFDAFVTDRGTAIGKQVNTNDPVARLIDADWLEARFHVTDSEFARLIGSGGIRGRDAAVVWHAQARDFVFDATIERASSEVNPASGGVDLFARIHDTGIDTVLRPGVFVEVRVPDQVYEDVVRLPNAALQGEDTVYVVAGERLEPRAVTLVARTGNDVLVHGDLRAGERVAAATFAEIGPGVKVEVR